MHKMISALGLALALFSVQTAGARVWKPTPQQQAQDYSAISHNKGATDGRVAINWLVGPAFTGNVAQMMEKYVVLTITHTITNAGGVNEYQDIEGVDVTDQAGHALKPVQTNDEPPNMVSLLAGIEASLRQSTQGKAKVKILVFEAGTVHACEKNSGLAVTFEGEKYTYETPIPGCVPAK